MGRFQLRATPLRVLLIPLLLMLLLLIQYFDFCCSINDEGRALLRFKEMVEIDPYNALSNWYPGEVEGDNPCRWFGVGCQDERVVSLNLEDLHLMGTLTPDIAKLFHLRYLILNNNSFYGDIPKEIGEFQKLEVLNLGYNNLSGSLPSEINNILSLEVFVVRGNPFLESSSVELHQDKIISDMQVDDSFISVDEKSIMRKSRDAIMRRILRTVPADESHAKYRPLLTQNPIVNFEYRSPVAPPPHARSPTVTSDPTLKPSPSPSVQHSRPVIVQSPPSLAKTHQKVDVLIYLSMGIGASLLFISAVLIVYHRCSKVVVVKPWATGLSGQLQKAFVTGVPVLRRPELEAACEDFSNIIGSLKDCIMYKGTLSSGVEIAVTSAIVKSSKDWSTQSEAQFRQKIATLSKVNHKNFVNLLGYCEEKVPFTRMMVFEYAPNGTLFDHLHINGAKDLHWAARLRIMMGIAYCLDYMQQLSPPVILKNLDSASIYLTDDYAAKISDLELWSATTVANAGYGTSDPLADQILDQAGIVYKFGILLLEIISAKLPHSGEYEELSIWASDYLRDDKLLKDMVDPELTSFPEEDIKKICDVIRPCLSLDPNERPSMKEIAGQLREITAVHPDGATPKLSPLWWAELEIISTEAS